MAEAEQRLAALVAERGEERRRWDEARAQYEAQRRADARRAAAEAAELRAEAAELRDHLKQERSEVYKLRDVAQVLRLFFVLSFCRFPFFFIVRFFSFRLSILLFLLTSSLQVLRLLTVALTIFEIYPIEVALIGRTIVFFKMRTFFNGKLPWPMKNKSSGRTFLKTATTRFGTRLGAQELRSLLDSRNDTLDQLQAKSDEVDSVRSELDAVRKELHETQRRLQRGIDENEELTARLRLAEEEQVLAFSSSSIFSL